MIDKAPLEMDQMPLEQRDELLYGILKYLRDLPREKRSVVVAGIYDLETNQLYAASSRAVPNTSEYGMWNHAEFEAMQLAFENGADPSKCIVITSLSPCVVGSSCRPHDPCANMLLDAGFKNIHTGHIDIRQATLGEYREMGLNITVTENQQLARICVGLDRFFDPDRADRKKGESKQGYIDEVLKDLPEDLSV
jgi:tRNA(Arg) A34 adenosine deaminase TadA